MTSAPRTPGLTLPRLLLLLALALWDAPALADSWSPPTKETYQSVSRSARLTVTPRKVSALAYFEDKVEGGEPAGQRAGEAPQPLGLVEVKGPDGRWTRLWEGPLVNDVAPVSALVSEDGRRAVTFDNWYSRGRGDDVIVIYDEAGRAIATYGLDDFLPAEYIRALPRSISSIGWSGKHRISEDAARLILQVVVPDGHPVERRFVELEIDLASGKLVPPQGAAWEAAKATAVVEDAAQRAGEARWEAAFRAPLLPPTSGKQPDWHDYLREAFYRVDPNWKEGAAGTTVIRSPAAPDYRASLKFVSEALADPMNAPGDTLMFGSPDEADLVAVLGRALRKLRPGQLKGMRVYVSVGKARRGALAEAVARTGAEFVPLDPSVPIPQREERLRAREAGTYGAP